MAKTDFEMFEKFWHKEIDKLDKGEIDERGAKQIRLNFYRNRLRLESGIPTYAQNSIMIQKLDLLESKLIRVIAMARAQYNLKNKDSLAKILISVFVPTIALVIAIILKLL